MAEDVVDHLEPVEVEEQERESGALTALEAGQGLADPVQEVVAVGQPGEGVAERPQAQRDKGPVAFDRVAQATEELRAPGLVPGQALLGPQPQGPVGEGLLTRPVEDNQGQLGHRPEEALEEVLGGGEAEVEEQHLDPVRGGPLDRLFDCRRPGERHAERGELRAEPGAGAVVREREYPGGVVRGPDGVRGGGVGLERLGLTHGRTPSAQVLVSVPVPAHDGCRAPAPSP